MTDDTAGPWCVVYLDRAGTIRQAHGPYTDWRDHTTPDVPAGWAGTVVPITTPPPATGTSITDDMVERAAVRLAEVFAGDEGQWRGYWQGARRALEAALAGRVPVALPEPDMRTAGAWVEHWNRHPDTLPQEERFALQRLADIREARRLADTPDNPG